MPMFLKHQGLNRRAVAGIRDEALPGMDSWCLPPPPRPIYNVLTIDLDGRSDAADGPGGPISSRLVENTRRCVQILRWHHVKATFFVSGCVAERCPALVREVHAAGHEIASRGYDDEPITNLTPRQFEADVRRSLGVLRGLVGETPVGYRAPAFSMVESTRWAGPILGDLGFTYSSSVFPNRHPHSSLADVPRRIHRWRDIRLIECPPATLSLFGRNWPVGGGCFRLLPGPVVRGAVRRLNRLRLPAILCLHPHDLDADDMAFGDRPDPRPRPSRGLQAALAVPHGLKAVARRMFRGCVEERLHRLCERFRFATLRDLLKYAV